MQHIFMRRVSDKCGGCSQWCCIIVAVCFHQHKVHSVCTKHSCRRASYTQHQYCQAVFVKILPPISLLHPLCSAIWLAANVAASSTVDLQCNASWLQLGVAASWLGELSGAPPLTSLESVDAPRSAAPKCTAMLSPLRSTHCTVIIQHTHQSAAPGGCSSKVQQSSLGINNVWGISVTFPPPSCCCCNYR